MFRDRIPGGKADNKEPSDFSPDQLQKGIKHEMEHTNDPGIAKEIAMDHLAEDPYYYEKLEKAKLQQDGMGRIFERWRGHVKKLFEASCKIPMENNNLEKDDMPQIKPEMIQDFILDLQDQGVQVFKTRVKVEDLEPSQGQLEWDKIQQLMKQGVERLSHGVPIFVSKNNEIADGHHRWYALLMLDRHADMPVWQVDMDVLPLIHRMKRFEDTQNQEQVYSDQLEE